MMEKSERYNPEVDVWRFLFALAVFFHHSHHFKTTSGQSWFLGGFLGVEFFFMVSGYLMASKIALPAGGELPTHQFLWRKIRSIYPYVIASFFLAFVSRQIVEKAGLLTGVKNLFLGANEGLLLQMYGMFGGKYNRAMWYLSAMLIAMAILYSIACRWKDFFFHVGAPMVGLISYGILYQCSSRLTVTDEWYGVIMLGVIRAIAGISLGVFCYICCEKVKKYAERMTVSGNRIFMLVEIFTLFLLLCIFNFSRELGLNNKDYDYVAVMLLFILVFVVFSELTGIKQRFKKPQRYKALAGLYILLIVGGKWSYRHYMFWYVIGTGIAMLCCYLLVKGVTVISKRAKPSIAGFFLRQE